MPCLARAVAQPPQCLWITDDVLAEAFHRFARVSYTARRHGSHVPLPIEPWRHGDSISRSSERRQTDGSASIPLEQHRHGSIVPGPLEARRRLAKRRMAMAAIEPSGSNAMASAWDSLFRFDLGKWFRQPLEKCVKYQPPRIPPSQEHGITMSFSPAVSGPFLQQELETPQVNAAPKPLSASLVKPSRDPVEESRAAFNTLLTTFDRDCADSDTLDHNAVKCLVDFLSGPENDPLAHNCVRLLQWLKGRNVKADALTSFTSMVQHKISLSSILDEELFEVLRGLLDDEAHAEMLISLVTDLGEKDAAKTHKIVLDVTRHILAFSDHETRRATLDTWLWCLRSSPCAIVRHTTLKIHRDIYSLIASKFKPSQLPKHFDSLREDMLIGVLVKHWVAPGYLEPPISRIRYHCGDFQKFWRHRAHNESLDMKTSIMLSPHTFARRGVAAPSCSDIWTAYSKLRNGWAKMTVPKWRRHRMIDLIVILSNYRLPYTNLLDELFTLHRQRHGSALTEVMFWDLRHRKGVGIPLQFAKDMLKHALDQQRHAFAYRLFMHTPGLALRDCLELPLRLIHNTTLPAPRLFSILNRRTTKDRVRILRRGRVVWGLHRKITDAVATMAIEMAQSKNYSARAALRRVWQCIQFLRAHYALPYNIRSLKAQKIARALVHAGIQRYDEERRPLSAEKVKYIVSMVTKLEGEEEARMVDQLAFELNQKYMRRGRDMDRPIRPEIHRSTVGSQFSSKTSPSSVALRDRGAAVASRASDGFAHQEKAGSISLRISDVSQYGADAINAAAHSNDSRYQPF